MLSASIDEYHRQSADCPATLYSRLVIAGPDPIVERVDTGIAELVPDGRDGWTLLVDGVEQSYVCPTRPRELGFDYLQRLATVLDSVATPGAPQRVLHLGGGALSLPRYLVASRPGSYQVVVEHDAALAALVRRVLPLPSSADIAVHVGDARAFVEATTERFDIVVSDVFQGAQMDPGVASVEFAQSVARLLRPHGVHAVNVTDSPGLIETRVHAATLRAVFASVALIIEARLLRGRRYGNSVLAAGRSLPMARLSRANAPDARVLHGPALTAFIAGTGPRRDAD
jgi:hypothetical protein